MKARWNAPTFGLAAVLAGTVAAGMAAFASAARAADQPLTEGSYSYTVEGGKATIVSYFGAGQDFLLIPSTIGGYPVTTVGNGVQSAYSNGGSGVVLFPDSVTKISNRAIYDYNSTYFISIPASVTRIEDGATSSVPLAHIVGVDGTPAQSYAKQVGIAFSSDTVPLKAEAGAGGKMSIVGTYLVPAKLQRSYTLRFEINADRGYQIEDVQVDGVSVQEAKGKSSYVLPYALNAANSKGIAVKAVFAPGANAGAAAAAPATAAASAPAYEFPDHGASVGRYANAIGICAGKFYATVKDGKTVVYQLVESYTSKDGSIKFRQTDEVKKYAADHGLVFGKDYDTIHVYNYNEGGSRIYYVAYLYKVYDGPMTGVEAKVGDLESAKAKTNGILDISSIFAQNKAELNLKDWTISSFSNYLGPVEGTNFFGADSAVLADSGAIINLDHPKLYGSANIVFATYKSKINITGGSLLGIAQGAHGAYVANGGKIYFNAAESAEPALASRPDPAQAYIVRDKKTENITLVNKLGTDASAMITAQSTGTVLATDSGGGTIVVNRLVGKSYGQGSGGVYSIGSNDGLVYIYNSSLTSYMDAGLVSASGGFIHATNSIIQGLMGIKLRAGQNSTNMSEVRVRNSELIAFFDKDELERVFDVTTPEEAKAYLASGAKPGTFFISLFAGRGGGVGSATDSSAKSWFDDGYSNVPGGMGGTPFSVIYTEGSKTPIYIENTKLLNKNYAKYKDAPGSKAKNLLIDAEGNGTANVFFFNDNSKTKWDLTGVSKETTELVGDFNVSENTQSMEQRMGGGMPGGMPGGGGPGGSAQGGGAGAPGGQMPGGMQSGAPGGGGGEGAAGGPGGGAEGGPGGGGMPGGGEGVSGGMPGGMPGGGMPPGMETGGKKGNYLNATFQDSEWQGTVVGLSKNANLTFDEKSSWKVTADTAIDTLTVAPGTVISADRPVTVSVAKLAYSGSGAFKAGKNVKIETRQEEAREDNK